MARVVFSRIARDQLAELPTRIVEAVLDAIRDLEADTRVGKQLHGRLEGLWSLRIGSYRLVYEVRDKGKTVRVIAALHRRVAYRSDPR